MKKELYKIKEAAKLLDVSYVWLDKAVREGLITSVWVGGHRAISVEVIEQIKLHGVKRCG